MSDVMLLDESMAERIIRCDRDVPYELRGLVAIVEELRDTPIPAGGDDVVLAMVAARQHSIGRSRRLRVRTESSLVAALALTLGLAAAGDLPAAAQNTMHSLLRDVGIHVPYHPRQPARVGSWPAATSTGSGSGFPPSSPNNESVMLVPGARKTAPSSSARGPGHGPPAHGPQSSPPGHSASAPGHVGEVNRPVDHPGHSGSAPGYLKHAGH